MDLCWQGHLCTCSALGKARDWVWVGALKPRERGLKRLKRLCWAWGCPRPRLGTPDQVAQLKLSAQGDFLEADSALGVRTRSYWVPRQQVGTRF